MTYVYNPFINNLDNSGTSSGGTVTSVSGTLNRITSTGGTTPVIDIAATYVGQTSITTLGTITTGTWNGAVIGAAYGGTGQSSYAVGDILYASGATTLSKLAVGANGQVLTLALGLPSWATPTTGTVTSVSGTANRITSTGGATPVIDISASYVGQTSITTLGTITTGVWTGTDIALADGGTGASLTASTGGIVYSGASALAILAGTSTAGQILISGATAAPSWLATANSGVLTTSTSGAPSIDTTNFHVLTTGVQMKGNGANTAPPAGFIGETISNTLVLGSATSLSSGTPKTVTSIDLTAGIWDISFVIGFGGGAVTGTAFIAGVATATNSTTGWVEGNNNIASPVGPTAVTNFIASMACRRELTTGASTIFYLTALSVFTVGTVTAWGRLSAVRVG